MPITHVWQPSGTDENPNKLGPEKWRANHTGTLEISEVVGLEPALAGKETAGAAAGVQSNLDTHDEATTGAHGGIVAEGDSRLSDPRTPTNHGSDKHSVAYEAADPAIQPHITGTGSPHTPAGIGAATASHDHASAYEPKDTAIQTHITGTGSPHTAVGVGAEASGTVETHRASGTHSTAQPPAAHNQGADTITTGTLDGDRLPTLSVAKRGGCPATGTPSGKYLKDNGTWDAPAGGSGLTQAQVLACVSLRC
jgi:hypothetical protein